MRRRRRRRRRRDERGAELRGAREGGYRWTLNCIRVRDEGDHTDHIS